MVLWLLTVGLLSILGQVILLRELNVAFFGSELIYILAFGVWLLWTATGAMLGRRRSVPAESRVRLLLLLFSLALPLSIVFIRGVRIVFGAVPGAYLPFPQQILAMLLSLLPAGILLGLLFQWVAKLYVGRGRTLARAYAIESAGGLVGGGLATLFLKWGLQNLAAGLICGVAALVAALLPWDRDRLRRLGPPAVAAGGLLTAALIGSGWLDSELTSWNHPRLAAVYDTPYGRVTVTEAAGQISIFENDELAFESEGTAAEEFVHLAALQRVSCDSVLVLGGGLAGLIVELVEHRPQLIDYVEMNGALLEIMTRHLPPAMQNVLATAPVRVAVADPRRFLRHSQRYDLILVGMPEPSSARVNRFYTRDFFAQCADRLTDDGVLAFRVRAAENLWTPQLVRRMAGIRRALGDVFPSVVILPGVTNIVLASKVALPDDPQLLAARFRERGITARLVSERYIRYLYTNDRFAEIADLLAASGAPANTDARPICYQVTLLIWLSKFFPVLGWLELPEVGSGRHLRSLWTWAAVIAGLALLLSCRLWAHGRRLLLVFLAGFVGMILESILILAYQTRSGALYQDLGILLTLVMAGLAAGAIAVDHAACRSRDRGSALRRIGCALILALVLLSALVAWRIEAGAFGGLATTAILLLLCGFLVAGLFAFASLQGEPDQKRIVSPLYAADLLGGCLGSVAASLLLIPMVGLSWAALLMVLLAAGALWVA